MQALPREARSLEYFKCEISTYAFATECDMEKQVYTLSQAPGTYHLATQ